MIVRESQGRPFDYWCPECKRNIDTTEVGFGPPADGASYFNSAPFHYVAQQVSPDAGADTRFERVTHRLQRRLPGCAPPTSSP